MPLFNSTSVLLSDSVPMPDNSNMGVTAHAALMVDSQLLTAINAKTAVRFWDGGTFANGTANTGDIIIMTDTMTISSSGNAVFNLTNDHTSTGTALCSSIFANSCVANFVDNTGVFSQGTPTIAGNLKTVTINTTKQTSTGVVVLSLTVLGSVQQSAAPNGTVVRFFGVGIAA